MRDAADAQVCIAALWSPLFLSRRVTHRRAGWLARAQSVTMSNWTRDEVMELHASTNGGNAIHNATYLARMPPTFRRPEKGCHPNDLKAFVQAVYIEQKFYDANGTPCVVVPENIALPMSCMSRAALDAATTLCRLYAAESASTFAGLYR